MIFIPRPSSLRNYILAPHTSPRLLAPRPRTSCVPAAPRRNEVYPSSLRTPPSNARPVPRAPGQHTCCRGIRVKGAAARRRSSLPAAASLAVAVGGAGGASTCCSLAVAHSPGLPSPTDHPWLIQNIFRSCAACISVRAPASSLVLHPARVAPLSSILPPRSSLLPLVLPRFTPPRWLHADDAGSLLAPCRPGRRSAQGDAAAEAAAARAGGARGLRQVDLLRWEECGRREPVLARPRRAVAVGGGGRAWEIDAC